MTRQTGKEAVHKLIEDFEKNESQYMSKDFQETETRNRFIDPFFTALGWELNQTSIARKFWDVHREYSQRDNSTTKKPDYAFLVKEGVKFREKFFVEAKAPHVDLNGNIPVFQAKRYAFSSHGKTPIVILTDFQTFRVFNGLEKPVFENPLQGLIKELDLEYHTYLDMWDLIWNAFSKEAVTEGSIEQLIGKVGRNAKSLDDEFLTDISIWRETLARNVALRNKDLSVNHINEAVQRIMDRLILVRNLEDRGIVRENTLLSILNEKENIYLHLLPLFKKLNVEYNGLLFKEHFSEKIFIDDLVIRDIVRQLCPPYSPYQFDMIEPEILGRIYERFLGSKIRLTENHQAKVEEKPEVKKAGGVYYTPQYIVDYIVENTVGVKIKDKTPEEIAEIKICDPACGSGSFLLGAFQYLIEYHREWYAKTNQTVQKKYKNDFFNDADNEIKLTFKKKTEILKNNIFGVDIDREATEVAIMSLYLKILDEGQTELFLPDIMENIKCGNSLVGTDFYGNYDFDLTDDDRNKVNCFDWEGKGGFAEILKNGGFDVMIGNPPYFNIQTLGAGSKIALYIQNKYDDIWQDKSDILFYFLVKAMQLSKGNIGFILSNAFLFSDKAQKLRNKIIDDGRLAKIVNFEQFQVFDGASITTGIFIFHSEHTELQVAVLKDKKYSISELLEYINSEEKYFKVKFEKNNVFALDDLNTVKINKKIDGDHLLLQDICLVGKGMETAANDVFLFTVYPKQFPKKFIKKRMIGENIERYFLRDNPDYLLYFEDIENFKDLPVSIQNHLNENRKTLKGRADKKRRPTASWWNYTFPMHKEYYHLPKIWCSYRSKENTFILDETNDYIGLTNTTVIFGTNEDYSLKYLLALLNSKLLTFRYKSIGKQTGNGVFEYFANGIGKLPIPKTDKKTQAEISTLVDKMLDLKQKEAAELSDHLKTVITRQIDAVDKAIDKAVYELYNLTADEIKVVES